MPSPITALKSQAMVFPVFRSARAILAVTGVSALLDACSTTSLDVFRNLSNMAHPEPLFQDNLSTTAVTSCLPTDTGNMVYSEPVSAGSIKHAAIAARC